MKAGSETVRPRAESLRFLPTHWCEDCKRAYIHNADGKVACPKCGKPPVARGVPVVAEFTRHRERRVTR